MLFIACYRYVTPCSIKDGPRSASSTVAGVLLGEGCCIPGTEEGVFTGSKEDSLIERCKSFIASVKGAREGILSWRGVVCQANDDRGSHQKQRF